MARGQEKWPNQIVIGQMAWHCSLSLLPLQFNHSLEFHIHSHQTVPANIMSVRENTWIECHYDVLVRRYLLFENHSICPLDEHSRLQQLRMNVWMLWITRVHGHTEMSSSRIRMHSYSDHVMLFRLRRHTKIVCTSITKSKRGRTKKKPCYLMTHF